MKASVIPADKVVEESSAPDPGYEAWKRAKVRRARKQAENDAEMIPAEQVWRDLGLEG